MTLAVTLLMSVIPAASIFETEIVGVVVVGFIIPFIVALLSEIVPVQTTLIIPVDGTKSLKRRVAPLAVKFTPLKSIAVPGLTVIFNALVVFNAFPFSVIVNVSIVIPPEELELEEVELVVLACASLIFRANASERPFLEF